LYFFLLRHCHTSLLYYYPAIAAYRVTYLSNTPRGRTLKIAAKLTIQTTTKLSPMADTSVVDRQALQDLLLNYAASVDGRNIDQYRACFANTVEVVGFGPETFHGRDNWVNYVWNALDQYSATQHMLGPQLATINGDSANTRSDVQALHFLKDGGGRFTLWATYITDMKRIAGRWLITRHELKICGTSTEP
jgi:hypothetical protein